MSDTSGIGVQAAMDTTTSASAPAASAVQWKTRRETVILPDVQHDFQVDLAEMTSGAEGGRSPGGTRKVWVSFADTVHAPVGGRPEANGTDGPFEEVHDEEVVFTDYPEQNPSFHGKFNVSMRTPGSAKHTAKTRRGKYMDMVLVRLDDKSLRSLTQREPAFGKDRPYVESEQQTMIVAKQGTVSSDDNNKSQGNTVAKTTGVSRSVGYRPGYTGMVAAVEDLKSIKMRLDYTAGQIDLRSKNLEAREAREARGVTDKDDSQYVYTRPGGEMVNVTPDCHSIHERFLFQSPTTVFESTRSKLDFAINSIDVSSVGDVVIVGGEEGNLALLDTGSGKVVRNYEGHVGDVTRVQFFPSNKVFLSGGADSTIKIWAIEHGESPATTLVGHKGGIIDTCMIDRGRNFLSSSRDSTLALWECSTSLKIWDYTLKLNEFNDGIGKPGVINEITTGSIRKFYEMLKSTRTGLMSSRESNLYDNYYKSVFEISTQRQQQSSIDPSLEHGVQDRMVYLATSEQSWIGIDMRMKRAILRDPLFSTGSIDKSSSFYSLKSRQYNDRRRLTSIAYTDGLQCPTSELTGHNGEQFNLPYSAPLLATGSESGIVTIFDLRNTCTELYTLYNYSDSVDFKEATFEYSDRLSSDAMDHASGSPICTLNHAVELELPRRKNVVKLSFVDDGKNVHGEEEDSVSEGVGLKSHQADLLVSQADGQSIVLPLDLTHVLESAAGFETQMEPRSILTHREEYLLSTKEKPLQDDEVDDNQEAKETAEEEDEVAQSKKPFARVLTGCETLGGISNTAGGQRGQCIAFVDSAKGSTHSKQFFIATRADEFEAGSTIRSWKWV